MDTQCEHDTPCIRDVYMVARCEAHHMITPYAVYQCYAKALAKAEELGPNWEVLAFIWGEDGI